MTTSKLERVKRAGVLAASGEKALAEYKATAAAIDERTKRLKAERLAREASIATGNGKKPSRARKPKVTESR